MELGKFRNKSLQTITSKFQIHNPDADSFTFEIHAFITISFKRLASDEDFLIEVQEIYKQGMISERCIKGISEFKDEESDQINKILDILVVRNWIIDRMKRFIRSTIKGESYTWDIKKDSFVWDTIFNEGDLI